MKPVLILSLLGAGLVLAGCNTTAEAPPPTVAARAAAAPASATPARAWDGTWSRGDTMRITVRNGGVQYGWQGRTFPAENVSIAGDRLSFNSGQRGFVMSMNPDGTSSVVMTHPNEGTNRFSMRRM